MILSLNKGEIRASDSTLFYFEGRTLGYHLYNYDIYDIAKREELFISCCVKQGNYTQYFRESYLDIINLSVDIICDENFKNRATYLLEVDYIYKLYYVDKG